MMNLGDVKEQTVPKMILVAPPRDGGVVSTRSFIPHRAHATIGVFAAVSVATACLLPGEPGARHRADSRWADEADAGRAPDRRQPSVDDDRGARRQDRS